MRKKLRTKLDNDEKERLLNQKLKIVLWRELPLNIAMVATLIFSFLLALLNTGKFRAYGIFTLGAQISMYILYSLLMRNKIRVWKKKHSIPL